MSKIKLPGSYTPFVVIYFSYTGNNRVLASTLAHRLQCDAYELKETRKRSGVTIFLDLLFRRMPKLEPLSISLDQYEHLILLAPVWNGNVAHPMQSFIRQRKYDMPDYAFATLCGNDPPSQGAKLEAQLTQLAGRPPKALQQFAVRDFLPADKRDNAIAASKYRVLGNDMFSIETKIGEFFSAIDVP